jgi:hypothetical protein
LCWELPLFGVTVVRGGVTVVRGGVTAVRGGVTAVRGGVTAVRGGVRYYCQKSAYYFLVKLQINTKETLKSNCVPLICGDDMW